MAKAAIPAAISAVGGIGAALLSKGSGGGGQQMQEKQTSLPGWVENAGMENYGAMTKASYEMPGPYEGQRVADLTPETLNLINQLYGNVGSTLPAFTNASAITNALSGFSPSMVTPQSMSKTALEPYMNPFTSAVIDPTMKLLDQQRQNALNQIGTNATGAHAFGGSRQGVAEGVTNSQYGLQGAQLGSQLYNQNWMNATQLAQGDIQRQLQADLANQGAGLQGAQFRANMAQQLASLAQSGQQNWLAGLQAAMAGQGALEQKKQQQLTAAQQLYEEQRQDPIQRINLRTQQLANSPYGSTTYQSGPGPTTSGLATGLGTASTLAGILGMAGMFGGSSGGNGGVGNWLKGASASTPWA